mmetsp:Transcript_43289/g.80587  ORF Transcript_43289/g.80587 Transcript_43289/m.80587 type:complete len:485 (-) Transcript_43289:94-1548(-)
MVDLTLEALEFEAQLQKDIYVAVRVGEVQKLSKMAGSRAYKFTKNAIGERRFGKVDVFKRIGSASIGIKPDTDGEQEIKISCGPDTAAMPFRVKVGSTDGDGDKAAAKNVSPKVHEAKQYLLEHNLEMRLSEAMQAVLREKPKDPAGFISDMLLKNENQLTRVGPPPAPVAEKQAEAPAEAKAGFADYYCKHSRGAIIVETMARSMFPSRQGAAKAAAPPPADAMAGMRELAKKNLIEASGDGRLDKALSNLRAAPADKQGLEELRMKAKGILVDSSNDGKLDVILADMKGSQAPADGKLDEIRKKAKDTLIGASVDGKLDAVLADLKGGAPQGEGDLEALRVQAKDILMSASANGKLDEVLATMPAAVAAPAASGDLDTEQLRSQAKQALLDASLDGRLQKTLQDGLMPAETQVLDKLREQAKSTLLEASMDGRLEETLQAAIAETTPAPVADAARPLFMMPLSGLYGPSFSSFNITPGFIVR